MQYRIVIPERREQQVREVLQWLQPTAWRAEQEGNLKEDQQFHWRQKELREANEKTSERGKWHRERSVYPGVPFPLSFG